MNNDDWLAEQFEQNRPYLRAKGARLAMVDGMVGAAWAPQDRTRAAFSITVRAGKVVAIEVLADPDTIRSLGVTLIDA